MKRMLVAAVVVGVVVITAGAASAKGYLREIRISGGDLPREIRIAATNEDLDFHWGAQPREPGDPSYAAVFFSTFSSEGGRLYPSSPNRYYPPARGKPAVLMQDARNWYSIPASLARRLNAAISAALGGNPLPAPPGDRVVTSWPLLGVDVAILLAIVAGVQVGRGWFRCRSVPAPVAPA
jgi:hypothetical protein